MDSQTNQRQSLAELLTPAIQNAVNQALLRHRKLGETIVILRDGQIVELTGDEIPITEPDKASDEANPR